MTTVTQKPKDGTWHDESGTPIPYNRTTKVERLHERSTAKILKEALKINERLNNFKSMIRLLSQEAYDAYMASKDVKKKSKGNFTWYNFNRSVKIEVSVNEPISFDDLGIAAAKDKFDQFLDKNVTTSNEFVKEIITGAFETERNSKLDTKQVLNLTRYVNKVKDPLFTEAVKLIQEAIRRPQTKTYFRVWQKDADGEYQNIDLNLSSI